MEYIYTQSMYKRNFCTPSNESEQNPVIRMNTTTVFAHASLRINT